jgi:hypothetical protein
MNEMGGRREDEIGRRWERRERENRTEDWVRRMRRMGR